MGAPQDLIAGRYRLQRRIAAGGMGVVWEARDELLQRPVAVKQLRTQAGVSDDDAELAKQRAMREARITARLHHPHAVPVFDAVEHDGEPCLVMQYVPSEPLSALVKRQGTLPVGEVARIGAEVAAALAAAHALGIVHRDVKPGNILIADADGAALLSDFGISHALGDATLTSTGFVHGTPAYLAPEVARGDESTFASDVFSLGSTLYAASEGRAPFGEAPNSIAVLHRVASGGFDAPSDSGLLGPLLLQMMASDPEARPTMAVVARRLAAVQADAVDEPVATLPLVSTVEPDEDDPDQPTAWVPVDGGGPETLVAGVVAGTATTALADEPAADEPAAHNPSPVDESAVDASAVAAAAADAPPTTPAPAALSSTRTTPTRTTPTVIAPLAAEAPVVPPSPIADEPAAVPSSPDRRRRRRGLLIGAVVVLLLLVGGFGLLRSVLPGSTPTRSSAAAAPAVSRSTASSAPTAAATSSAASPTPTTTPTPTPTPTSTPTASPTPSATPTSNAGGTATGSPVAAIRHYYTLVPNDTSGAWPLLTAAYQSGHAGGRQAYDRFWAPVRSISATNVRSIGTNLVEATLTYRRDDGSVSVEDTTFRLVQEGGVLKIADSSVN